VCAWFVLQVATREGRADPMDHAVRKDTRDLPALAEIRDPRVSAFSDFKFTYRIELNFC